ncbi:ABC transporter ATP-binding protein [Listeria ivanovii]|uniref:ABC transporter ATP-binding protein n=2 Tax=Listeria ivanovii TaxID=1638 RepID=A0ABS1G694_LISIV|nr:ABC transporter ATP-binding protein [Listeria ivanovii]EFR96632.1 ABC transporter, ATPase component [Listeria ivanovii FSL F6-596]AIS60126.1 ABC transporter ATPase [Listeria ivanovii subsp. londoniensis]AIS62952.1 ABC transporter ATPase [Listeria ivanovii subsp. londoniensis]MBK1962400.1 ABC transporter ATP-binding protein [Listeria ivanovii subsp. londoniensis]MBK1967376.1 ABC transporter ATP-binding protein [Listeria ivanovii subsp. londoniensis]
MTDNIITITGLTKKYRRHKPLNDINLTLEQGKIIGLLGPNGAGKTTLLNAISGLLKSTSGSITMAGDTRIAYLPSEDFLPNMVIRDYFQIYHGFFPDFSSEKATEMIHSLGVNVKENTKYLSKGNAAKVMLTLILCRDASLYLLDEPFSEIDLISRDDIVKSIARFLKEEATLVITTHLIQDMEMMFDEIILMNRGEIIDRKDTELLRDVEHKSVVTYYREVFGHA